MNNFKNLIKSKRINVALFLGIGIAIVAVVATGTAIMTTQGGSQPSEITSERTLNSKTFGNTDGSFTLEAHVGHIHYLDKNTGKLEKIDTTLLDKGTYWEMRKAGYEIELPQQSNGSIRFFSNKFDKDLYSVSQNNIPDLVKSTHFLTQKNVDFVPSKINGQDTRIVNGGKTSAWQITYPEILDGIDLVLCAGRNSFRKELVIRQKQVFTGDFLEIEFLTNAPAIGKIKGVKFENNEIHFRPARAWDANGKIIDIELDFQQGKMIKRIPKAFLENAVYPVRTDTTTSYYSGAGDGQVRYDNVQDWSTTHDATNGTSASTAVATALLKTSVTAGSAADIVRVLIPIDTSGIPAAATISTSTLYTNAQAVINTDTDEFDYLTVVQTSQASTTVLGTADYDQVGAVTNPTEGIHASNRIDFGTIVAETWQTFSLTATTGLPWVKKSGETSNCGTKTGMTCLGLREGHDATNNAVNNGTEDIYYPRMSEYDGNDPYLTVTYSAPAVLLEFRKSNDEDVSNSTTTLQIDDELILTLDANKAYMIDGAIFASSTNNIPDIKIAFNTPGAASWITKIGFIAASNSFQYAELLEGDFATSSAIGITANKATIIQISGTVKTDNLSGNLELFWAQANSNDDPTTVKAGSYLRANEIQ